MNDFAAIKLLQHSKPAKETAKRELLLRKLLVAQGQAGFTLLELLVVIIIIGAIAAIAVPNWLGFVNQRRVNAANDTLLRALQDAQSQAKTKKVSYSVSFRTDSGKAPEVAVYATKTPITPTANNPSGVQDVDPYTASNFNNWKSLGQDLAIKPGQVLLQTNVGTVANNQNQANQVVRSATGSGADSGTITFDEMGALSQDTNPNLGGTSGNPKGLIVMVAVPNGNNPIQPTQRCIKVLTLLGSLQIQKGDQCNF